MVAFEVFGIGVIISYAIAALMKLTLVCIQKFSKTDSKEEKQA